MNASPAACLGQRLQAVQAAATERDCAATWTTSSCDRASDSRTPRTIFRQARRFTYRSGRRASSWQYPASVARVQATACARVKAIASSWSRPLILTTLDISWNSAIASASASMYRRRRRGCMDRSIALPCSASSVSSTDGSGISAGFDGGKATAGFGKARSLGTPPRGGGDTGARNAVRHNPYKLKEFDHGRLAC